MPHPNPRIRAAQAARRKAAGKQRARRAGYRRSTKGMTNLQRMVQQIVRRNEETKYVANQYDGGLAPLANQWYSQGSLAAVGAWYPAIPKLNQGTGDYQRVGNKIHPTSVAVSLKIHFNPENVDANSLFGVIYYGTARASKSWNVQSPVGNAAILDQGDGTNTTFDATLYKLNHPVDKKNFMFKRILFRLTKVPGIQNNDISGNTVVGGNYSTANGLQCKNFLLKFTPPKTIMYEDNTDGWPSNYAPVYAVGFLHADGSGLKVADNTLVQVSSQCHMHFKDA